MSLFHMARMTITLALVLATVDAATVPALGREPHIHLRPSSGPPAPIMVVRGHDFPPGAHGTIAWGALSRSFGEFTAGANSEFGIPLNVPGLPRGDSKVAAISAGAPVVPTAMFTIQSRLVGNIARIASPGATAATPSGTPVP